MELSGIKTYGISLKYSVPFRRGAEGIWWDFQSVPFHQMERNGPLVLIPSTRKELSKGTVGQKGGI